MSQNDYMLCYNGAERKPRNRQRTRPVDLKHLGSHAMRPSSRKHSPYGWPEQVAEACARHRLQLTPLRRRVLSILGESRAPLGAYAIIDMLSKVEGKRIAPPTVYRTLEFFLENGFLHKIESRSAFAPREHFGHASHGVLLLCEKCGHNEEINDPALNACLRKMAARAGFSPKSPDAGTARRLQDLRGPFRLNSPRRPRRRYRANANSPADSERAR